MKTSNEKPRYGFGEEVANSVTHGLGILLSAAGLVILIVSSVRRGDVWNVVSGSIFGGTMIFLYTASTLYHAVPNRRAKAVLQVFDHSAIFFLIAGTYTPFTLVSLRGPWGWSLFGVIWALAVFGLVNQFTPLRKFKALELSLYVGMGWAVVAAAKPLVKAVSAGGLTLLIAGGAAYTAGILFYVRRKIPYHHAIWHLFVLAGSLLHFFAVFLYVIPRA